MASWRIGDVAIDRVVEMEGPSFAPDELLPDAVPEAMAALLSGDGGWLRDGWIEAESGLLVMSSHSFVLRTGRHTILVDTCVGNDKERPGHPRWHRRDGTWLADLARAGVPPETVDFVLCTHLHVDHVGWNTRLVDGRWVPTFPNARYLFGRREYEYCAATTARGPAAPGSYGAFADSVLPVMQAGQAELVADDHELDATVRFEPAPGHTPGTVVIHVDSEGRRGLFSGDVFHHPAQIARPAWSSRFCVDPVQSRQTREALAARLADTDTLLLAAHFPAPTAGRVVAATAGYGFEAVGQ